MPATMSEHPHQTHDTPPKPRLLIVVSTLCVMLLWSGVLAGCGVRKSPLPAKDIEKPRYPPR